MTEETISDAALSQPHSIFAGEDEDPQLWAASGFAVALYSRRSPVKETPNEDAAAVAPLGPGALLTVVADGVGGGKSGDRAARITIERLLEQLDGAEPDNALRERVLSGLERANEEVLQLGVGAAATVTCVSVREGVLRSYQAGDTLCLVTGQRGKIKHQTVSHSPVGYLVESGHLGEDQAMEHEDRHLVSNTVGSPDMSIEMSREIVLARRDTVLLASDGLSDNLRIQEIVEIIRKGDLTSAARRLAERARERMLEPAANEPSKPDDLTFVLVRRT